MSSDVDEDGEVPDVAQFEGEAEDEGGHKVNQKNLLFQLFLFKTLLTTIEKNIHKLGITSNNSKTVFKGDPAVIY